MSNRKIIDQSLVIINDLTRELKESKKQIDSLHNEIYKLKSPKINISDKSSVNIEKILTDAQEAMARNVKRIEKEIKDAQSK